ncbi:MAG: lytic murein transglycosylase B [Pseudomonadales bacterium]|nr:lytic murein transglycosylase B [Pseudomonadales bacterium]
MELLRDRPVWLPWLLLLLAAFTHADYSGNPEVTRFIDEMVQSQGFEREALQAVFSDAVRQEKILAAISRPAEKTLTWSEYRSLFLGADRIEAGVAFWAANQEALVRAQAVYRVPPEYVVAIIGVETRYGSHRGAYRVIDALSTLAFDYPPRSAFFRGELVQFLVLSREERKDPLTLLGSYAGAMGYGQFIPSSYRAYAVDFDGDGVRDIWDNTTDAIGSVASYFARHGWRGDDPVLVDIDGEPAGVRAQAAGELEPMQLLGDLRRAGLVLGGELPDDAAVAVHGFQFDDGQRLAVAFNDFYVITRYNHSILYARAVHELAQAIRQRWATTAVGEPSAR